ncbi:MAG: hypothetical protein OEV08_04945 [Nitrospira sp.]|nr:hypothetical protein [Nitrospira sp.]
MMQVQKRSRNIGMKSAAAVIAAVLAVCGALPASADEGIGVGNQVFFRGGAAGMTSNRAGETFTDVYRNSGRSNNSTAGYYVGGGLDLLMHKDFLGIKGMSLMGELGVEFKRWNSNTVAQAAPTLAASAGGTTNADKVQMTMLTVDIAPKLKFMEGSRFRPWVIPVGLDFHVISPPSNQTQYLDIGVQFGTGFEYNFWGPLNLGIDARYHLASNQTNTVNNFGTAGAYLGILY